jgi:prolyl oligopeptidase
MALAPRLRLRLPLLPRLLPRATIGVLVGSLLAHAGCGGGDPQPVGPVVPQSSTPTPKEPVAVTPPAPKLPYPASKRGDTVDTLHGTKVADPYRWLEDVKSPDVQTWMTAQNDLARAELAKLPERDAIAARLKELFYVDSLSAPRHRGSRYFFRRRHASKEKAVIYWKEGKTGAEKVLFDPNTWSSDGSVALGEWEPSWDGKRVAWQERRNNSDEATIYVMDVATGKKSTVDVIEGGKYAYPSWTPQGDGFYYTWLPTDPAIKTADRPGFAEVRFHKLGEDPKKDITVRERTNDASTFVGGTLSEDGHWLVLNIEHGWTSTDLWIQDVRPSNGRPKAPAKRVSMKDGKPDSGSPPQPETAGPLSGGAWTPLVVGQKAHYRAEAYKDQLYVMTDEGAPRWRVFRVDPKKPERASWTEVVAERKDATLDGFSVIGGRLALTYLKNAASLLEVRELDGKVVREVPLPGIGTVGGPIGRQNEDEAYFSYESFTFPAEIHQTSMKSGETKLYSKVTVPVDPTPFTVTQVFYPSKDGTKVSMFLVHRKDLKRDGSARVMLYGYGGFLINQSPAFVSSAYPWLERGGIYAVPNLRGGGEYGEEWHQKGMLLQKQNVFDDFIGAAEYLIREKYTRPSRLAISGGSNGGLLTGAVAVQRPDLFGAVLCAVPLLDMVRYHLYGSGKTWTSEYGSAEDAAQFKALYAYSPYHHIKQGTKYPPLLLLSADSDDRVDPLHARKFAAAVQAATTGGPVLLRIEKNSGHGGADLLKAEVEKGADRYAFALAHTAR